MVPFEKPWSVSNQTLFESNLVSVTILEIFDIELIVL